MRNFENIWFWLRGDACPFCGAWRSGYCHRTCPELAKRSAADAAIFIAENWLLTRRNYVGQQVKHRGDCGKGVVNHACELCRLSIVLPDYANYLDSERVRELQQVREQLEATRKRADIADDEFDTLRIMNEQVQGQLSEAREEIARLKEALTSVVEADELAHSTEGDGIDSEEYDRRIAAANKLLHPVPEKPKS